jgi:HPt (histidine-containing phosphotransfer) domain-containing protein
MNEVKQDERAAPATTPALTSSTPGLSTLRNIRIDEALARFGGDEQRYRHWLGDFTQHGPNAAAQIRQAIVNGSVTAATQLTHALKGRTGMLGMSELHSISQTLELALANGDPPLMWLEELETSVHDMCQQIETLLGTADA